MIATAAHRPPSAPPPAIRDAVRSLGVLGGAAALVALATFALSGVIVPRPTDPTLVTPTDTTVQLDLNSAPPGIGGQLVVTGDRPGVLTVASESSNPGYEPDSSVAGGLAFERGEVVLTGPEGEIVLDPETGAVTRIEYDGLSFYLESGDCLATSGARNAGLGLMHIELRCEGITDLRDGAVIGLEGVVSVPADALGDRGDLPAAGGTAEIGGTELTLVHGVGIVGGFGPVDDGLVPLVVPASDVTGLGVSYDPEDGTFSLTTYQLDGALVELPQPCALPAEELGRINPQTTVVRLALDCGSVPLPDGGSGAVTGTVIVDLVVLDEGG
jgi:hypothetical protein